MREWLIARAPRNAGYEGENDTDDAAECCRQMMHGGPSLNEHNDYKWEHWEEGSVAHVTPQKQSKRCHNLVHFGTKRA
jgi:hypothetical protein